jgi:hypothetical protein
MHRGLGESGRERIRLPVEHAYLVTTPRNPDTTHITTSSHHPQANGMVERMNQTLKGAIKRDSAMADTSWDERMPLALLALRASSHAATKMAPSEVLLGHRIRMPVVGEAPTGQMESWWSAAEDLPPESMQEELLQIGRVNQMRQVERVALRNIDMMNLRVAAAAERRMTAPMPAGQAEPERGDLVVIRNFAHGAMQPEWESARYKCAGYNDTRTQMIVEEAGGKRWMENIKNVKGFRVLAEEGRAAVGLLS